MDIQRLPGWGVLAAFLLIAAACGGEPTAEDLLDESREVPALHAFGQFYLPLYEEAMQDSTWDGIRENIREIIRLKQAVQRAEAPARLNFEAREWASNMRLFSRAVDNLGVVMGWRGLEAEVRRTELLEAVQGVYDWWQMIVEML